MKELIDQQKDNEKFEDNLVFCLESQIKQLKSATKAYTLEEIMVAEWLVYDSATRKSLGREVSRLVRSGRINLNIFPVKTSANALQYTLK